MSVGWAVTTLQWALLTYFVLLQTSYLALNLSSLIRILSNPQLRAAEWPMRLSSHLEPPVSVLVPAFNEGASIEASLRALLQLDYADFEVIVVNDGSSDDTFDVLSDAFQLYPMPEAYRVQVACEPIHGIWTSRTHPNLRVIDKRNGGKADALNAALNAARYPLVCSIDADSILARNSLSRVVRPFLDDPRTVAAGGTVRIVNGCRVGGGFLEAVHLPRSLLALIQVVEYLRAFLFGRLGWVPANALMVISGAFSVFDKAEVLAVGGWRVGTVGEDMELVVRLHRWLAREGRDYRITFVPDPVCWTEAPEDLRSLARQRIRWQQGLGESLWQNRSLLGSRTAGIGTRAAFAFHALFEGIGPLLEVAGYLFFLLGYFLGWIDPLAAGAFLLLAVGLGMLLSVSAVLLEELRFHIYTRPTQVLALLMVAVVENFGYRQLTSVWRCIGLFRWLRGRDQSWGSVRRSGRLSDPAPALRHRQLG